MRKITLIQLQAHDACQAQVELFHSTFGESANLTKANLAKAIHAGLNFGWLVNLLPSTAEAEYDKACAPARAEYYKACAPARAEYDKACDAARAEYYKVRDAALFTALRKA